MTKGVIVSCEMLRRVTNGRIQLFNQHFYELQEGKAIRIFSFNNQKDKELDFPKLEKEISSIFREIKMLFDPQGKVIALRPDSSSLLKTTRENSVFKAKGLPGHSTLSTIERQYFSFEALEYSRWLKDMRLYCKRTWGPRCLKPIQKVEKKREKVN